MTIYPIVPPDPGPSPTNTKPVAEAGDNKDVTVSSLVTLDGSRSYDEDDDPLTYQWNILEKPEGSTATLSDNTSQKPTLQVDKDGYYKIQLVVNDGKEASDVDIVFITLNAPIPSNTPPIAVAGRAQKVVVHRGEVNTIVLDGRKSHDDGLILPLSYTWSAGKYSINKSVVHAKPSCADDWQRCYNADQRPICSSDITLTVFDGEFSDTDTTNITVDYSECEHEPILNSIHISPEGRNAPVGFTVDYVAVGTYSDGSKHDILNTATWKSSDTNETAKEPTLSSLNIVNNNIFFS